MSLSVNSVEDDQSPLLSSFNPDESSRGPSPRPLLERRVSDGRLRQPVNYQSLSGSSSYGSHDNETSAVISRYKYYTKLAPHSESNFTMPDHVVPGVFIITEITQIQGSQSSLVTIFSLWNTMMGTSLLSMPWAINQAGFTCGIILLLASAALMLYTSYRILHAVKCTKSTNEVIEFSDVCKEYLGRWAEVIAFVSSLLTLLGGMIVYWILLSNFLYNVVTFIYHHAQGDEVSTKGSSEFKSTFPIITGISALAYFVHNCVSAITRLQRHPENTVRDLIIAYALVALTYIYMGVIVYISFGLDKNCLEDNFLNNLKDTNVMAFVARIGLFFQMLCVFPLLVFIFRLQFMNSLFGSIWPSLTHVLVLNLVLIGVCIIFAVFLPHIGKIIGFVGAFCGFSYAIALPCLVYMKIRYEKGTLTLPIIIFHSILIVIGLANFIGQFLLLG
ncbi:sodium-coupled neutral amino acid transporter 9-like isoform X3 [Mercenaria mercenaria]|uniref:sodium-coupled neutral amino acid transporter 9-like isoform X3 n=1 Tax=Mercenaria mercenaria TaxID=6596 RepID=UPI00234F4AEB|nr:sodium-coupled neutral amino acid transporter 9-like isoform X3 [Mercenaria mercenaria]